MYSGSLSYILTAYQYQVLFFAKEQKLSHSFHTLRNVKCKMWIMKEKRKTKKEEILSAVFNCVFVHL